MANDVTNNPWVLDTAGVITTEDMYVGKLRWVGGTTAGHTAVVHDKNSKVEYEALAVGANNLDEIDFSGEVSSAKLFRGFDLETLSSGKLYVYLL